MSAEAPKLQTDSKSVIDALRFNNDEMGNAFNPELYEPFLEAEVEKMDSIIEQVEAEVGEPIMEASFRKNFSENFLGRTISLRETVDPEFLKNTLLAAYSAFRKYRSIEIYAGTQKAKNLDRFMYGQFGDFFSSPESWKACEEMIGVVGERIEALPPEERGDSDAVITYADLYDRSKDLLLNSLMDNVRYLSTADEIIKPGVLGKLTARTLDLLHPFQASSRDRKMGHIEFEDRAIASTVVSMTLQDYKRSIGEAKEEEEERAESFVPWETENSSQFLPQTPEEIHAHGVEKFETTLESSDVFFGKLIEYGNTNRSTIENRAFNFTIQQYGILANRQPFPYEDAVSTLNNFAGLIKADFIEAKDRTGLVQDNDNRYTEVARAGLGLGDFAILCGISEPTPVGFANAMLALREVPSTNIGKFDENRMTASKLDIWFPGQLHELVHEQEPYARAVIKGLITYFETGDPSEYQAAAQLTENLQDQEIRDSVLHPEIPSAGSVHSVEGYLDVLRKLDRDLDITMGDIPVTYTSLDIELLEIEDWNAENTEKGLIALNNYLEDVQTRNKQRKHKEGINFRIIELATWIENKVFESMQQVTYEQQQTFFKSDFFREALRFKSLTCSNTEFNQEEFDQWIKTIQETPVRNFEKAYHIANEKIISNIKDVDAETKKRGRVHREGLWSGTLDYQLMSFVNYRPANTAITKRDREERVKAQGVTFGKGTESRFMMHPGD